MNLCAFGFNCIFFRAVVLKTKGRNKRKSCVRTWWSGCPSCCFCWNAVSQPSVSPLCDLINECWAMRPDPLWGGHIWTLYLEVHNCLSSSSFHLPSSHSEMYSALLAVFLFLPSVWNLPFQSEPIYFPFSLLVSLTLSFSLLLPVSPYHPLYLSPSWWSASPVSFSTPGAHHLGWVSCHGCPPFGATLS